LFAAAAAAQDRPVNAPFGPAVVFLNVLLAQLGVPVPVVPTLVVAGALAAAGRLPATLLFVLILIACLIGDGSWYLAGRRYGGRVMKLLCRISLTPDVCVNDTQAVFERYGAKALIIAKFVPGLSMVAPPLAGATHMNGARFVLCSLLGSALWGGAALGAGALLRRQIEQLLPRLAGIGGAAGVLLALLLIGYVLFKWWERRRFYAALELARIEVAELHERLHALPAPLIVDVRTATAQSLERRRIPGALHVPLTDIERHLGALPREREIIFYCTCPNEASAAQAARRLKQLGFARVRPLRGGLEAWIAAGYAIEELTPTPAAHAPPAAADTGREVTGSR
jgi:membrane protein DedA with SNARE-associated domain/rhodanese-related sulfurtransferase